MNEIYNKNINAIKNSNVELYNKLKDIEYTDSDYIKITKNVNDINLVEIGRNGRMWPLGSRYNSKYAVEQWLKQYEEIHYKSTFIVFGLANGDYIRGLRNITGDENAIVVYEPGRDIFFKVINSIDISDILEDNRILICVNDINGETLEQYIKYGMNYELLELVRVSSSPNYFQLFKEEYDKMKAMIDKALLIQASMNITYRDYGAEVGSNEIRNIWELSKGSTINALKEVLQNNIDGVPAFIVSAGPSLDKNIDKLSKAKSKAFIVAVDSAIRKLLQHNIMPDIVVTVDSHKPLVLFESGIVRNIPLAVCNQSRHEIVRQHEGKRFVFAGECFYRSFLGSLKKTITGLSTGGSVANDAYSLAEYLGFETIILVGQDLAFTDNKKHASTVYDEKPVDMQKEGNDYIYVKDNDGNDILTYINFKIYKDWFEERIADNNRIKVINATEGGARIEGTIVMTLEEAISEYCRNNFDVDITKAAPMFTNEEMKEVYLKIKNMVNESDELINDIKAAINEYNDISNKLKAGLDSKKDLHKYMKKIQEVNSLIQNNDLMEIISLCSKPTEIEISGKIYKGDDDIEVLGNMVKYSRQLLESYMNSTEEIKKQLEYTIKNEIDVDIANGYLG